MIATLGSRVSLGANFARQAMRTAPVQAQSYRRFTKSNVCYAIGVGDKLPSATFQYFDNNHDLQETTTEQLTQGKKIVLVAIPGAFTPVCSTKHIPGFADKADTIKSKGVSTIAVVAVNDPFVMDAWVKDIGVAGKVQPLGDGSAAFTKAAGFDLDLSDKGLGIRSRRYAAIVDDGVIKELALEEGGSFEVSSADQLLEKL